MITRRSRICNSSATHQVADAGEQFGDQLHLIPVVVRVAVELADAQVRGDADAGLEGGQGDIGLLRQTLLRDVARDVGGDSRQGLRVGLGRKEHVLGVFRPRQARLGGAGLDLDLQRPFDPVQGEAVVIGRPLVALHRVGIGEVAQRRQVGDARHRHQVARGRVVAEGQERQRAGRALAGGDEGGERRVSQAVQLAGRHVAVPGAWLLTE